MFATENDYFASDWDKNGFLYVCVRPEVFCLLVPEALAGIVDDVDGTKFVIVSSGYWAEQKRNGIEILFEDLSDTPYALHLIAEQADPIPKQDAGKKDLTFQIITKDGTKKELPARYRVVGEIPYLQPWTT